MKPVIMVHGGAYAIPDAFADECMAAVKTAALEGFKVLVSGRSAVDAVESSVRSLEDNPILNAGKTFSYIRCCDLCGVNGGSNRRS
uniref:Asparaginase n=1 Tax=Erpetoichthys calabaricus TaxID=27687 RepID=A0A8C4T9F6_ERPCA